MEHKSGFRQSSLMGLLISAWGVSARKYEQCIGVTQVPSSELDGACVLRDISRALATASCLVVMSKHAETRKLNTCSAAHNC
jgi:hypothetical protein